MGMHIFAGNLSVVWKGRIRGKRKKDAESTGEEGVEITKEQKTALRVSNSHSLAVVRMSSISRSTNKFSNCVSRVFSSLDSWFTAMGAELPKSKVKDVGGYRTLVW